MIKSRYRAVGYYQELLKQTTPSRLVGRTRQSVIGHEGSLEDLVAALSFEVNRCVMLARGIDPHKVLSPAAILVMGSTGTGKTHTIKVVADAAGLKLFVFDVSSMTGEGWRGASMSNCLAEVADYQEANPGEICLVLFDEFDKAARTERNGDSIASSFSPSQSFLKLLEGRKMRVECENSKGVAIKTINLDQVVCILGGAFMGLDSLVRKRLNRNAGTTVGFGSSYAAAGISEKSANELRDCATIEDVEAWGIMPELCGRIGSVINFNALSVDDLIQIAYEQYLPKFNSMMSDGGKMEFTTDAVRLAAERAVKEGAGARGMLRQLRPLMIGAWRSMVEDVCITCSILVTYDECLAVRFERSPVPRFSTLGTMDMLLPRLSEKEIAALKLAGAWIESDRIPYPSEYAWLAELVDAPALDKIVRDGKLPFLAEVLLGGIPFDGLERFAAQELLRVCICYHDVFYAGHDEYRNLAYALTLVRLTYKESNASQLSPLDVIMNGTTTGNGFQGLSERIEADSKSAKPSLAEWQYAAAREALKIYDRFNEHIDEVRELAADASLMRVALAAIDDKEHAALEHDIKDLLASCK